MTVAVTAALGCGDKHDPPKAPAQVDPGLAQETPGDDEAPDPSDPEEAARPTFPEGTRSLELIRTVGVRLEPGDDATRIGTIAVDTRVGWQRLGPDGKGCKKSWIELRPRGWICSDYVKPSTRAPAGREVPFLERGELVPGVYGKVTAPQSVYFVLEKPEDKKKKDPKKAPKKTEKPGPVMTPEPLAADEPAGSGAKMKEDQPIVGSINVRQYEEVAVGGKVYWRVVQKGNQYVLASSLSKHRPSTYVGARLGDETGWPVPVAFVYPRGNALYSAWTTGKAIGGGVVRQVPGRTALPIFDVHRDPKTEKAISYRVGDAEWIPASQVRVFEPQPKPELMTEGERWIDIDLDNQILVAFEGDVPVYTTMVSTGAKETPTELGIYRMWVKESEADMKGLNGEDPYSVATVPWAQFFSPELKYAIHTAYWHDQFGTRRSHGCVNVAPRDARWLYYWSDPQVPPGWTMAAGVVEAPGSIVRVRNRETPNPPVRGYAIKVHEARRRARIH